jgi:DNA invertase Pin-like site-specific DNA recombinase
MSTTSVDEDKKNLIIQRRKEGVNMREIAKEFHLSFSTIGKIWNEREGQKEQNLKNRLHLEHFSYLKIK